MYTEIAANKRAAAFWVVVFFLLWIAIGAAVGAVFGLIHPRITNPAPVLQYVAIGAVGGGVFAICGIIFSLLQGRSVVLAVSGATPAPREVFPQLYNLVEALAIGDGLPIPDVYVINDPSPNAFATGISPSRAAITVTTGLLSTMNREELEGVLSHEMSHIKNYDVRLLLVVATLLGMAGLLASLIWRSTWFIRGGKDSSQLLIILVALGALLAAVAFIFGPLVRLAISRRREELADVSGVELTRNPAGLISALQKLELSDKPFAKFNHLTAPMCIDDPVQHHGDHVRRLFDTHPPLAERIAILQGIAAGKTA